MNTQGLKIIRKIEKNFNKLNERPTFSESQITERKMRLGQEVRDFEIKLEEEEIERVAIATLKEDFLKRVLAIKTKIA